MVSSVHLECGGHRLSPNPNHIPKVVHVRVEPGDIIDHLGDNKIRINGVDYILSLSGNSLTSFLTTVGLLSLPVPSVGVPISPVPPSVIPTIIPEGVSDSISTSVDLGADDLFEIGLNKGLIRRVGSWYFTYGYAGEEKFLGKKNLRAALETSLGDKLRTDLGM